MCTANGWAYQKRRLVDNHKRFVLDKRLFSSIIYIWYEGVRLRPRLVKLYNLEPGCHQAEPGPFRRNNGEEGKEGGEEEGCEEEEVSHAAYQGRLFTTAPPFFRIARSREARSKAQGSRHPRAECQAAEATAGGAANPDA